MPRPTTKNLSKVFFSDFSNNLGIHPVTGNITRLTNEESVKQSIRNIILTNRGERLYKPDLGGDIRKLLFENISSESDVYIIREKIQSTIKLYEPRVEVISIEVITSDNISTQYNSLNDIYNEPSNLGQYPDNSIMLNIVFRVINTDEQLNVNVIVERNR